MEFTEGIGNEEGTDHESRIHEGETHTRKGDDLISSLQISDDKVKKLLFEGERQDGHRSVHTTYLEKMCGTSVRGSCSKDIGRTMACHGRSGTLCITTAC